MARGGHSTLRVSLDYQRSTRDDSAPQEQKDRWASQWSDYVFAECELAEPYAEVVSAYETAFRSEERFEQRADSVPWYPEGFEEWNSAIAFKTVPGRLDCYRCKGLAYEFLPRYGCSSLYVEANHLDSQKRVYDWSNDTANNLDPGQSVFLEFYSYSYPSGNTYTRITEVSCR